MVGVVNYSISHVSKMAPYVRGIYNFETRPYGVESYDKMFYMIFKLQQG